MKKNSLITDMFEIRKGNITNISDSYIFTKRVLNIPVDDLLEENVSRYNFTETQKKLVNQCLSLNEDESKMLLAM